MMTGRVFVSHTSDMAEFPEGRSFVRAAVDAVNRAEMVPVDMGYFAAREGKPADYCRARVRECEVYVAVIGFRYGSMVPGEAVSYTELEFDEATSAGLPRLVFLLEDTAQVPPGMADADRGAVERFRQRACDAGLVLRTFSSDDGLELEVFHALTNLAGSMLAVAPEVKYSLPPGTAAFTGRGEELHRITAAVSHAVGSSGAAAILAIDGMPGVGKTALAVHAAHLLEGQFPDRQLFIDLHAHTPGRDQVLPEAALAGLLAAVGVDARHLPEDLEGRTGLWRDRMTGQRAVLVLDNAASSDQVAPLLLAGEGCLVLVTSRRHLGDLPGTAVPVQVQAMPPDQAQAMFARLAPRASADPAAVQELAALAGYLPLAISLLARVYASHPSWTLADLTAETRASLLTLTAEKDTIAAAFDVSYRYLAPRQQRFFRRLGLHPGTTIDAYAAAALAGTSLPKAADYLDLLHREGLLTETGYHRYGMHDLIRRYARDRAATDPGRKRALDRLLDYYHHTAAAAEARLARTSPVAALTPAPVAVPSLPDSIQALAWARAERANLLACLDHATRTGQHDRVVALTADIAAMLRQDGPWDEAITRHTAAVQAARHLGDRLGQANALTDLGETRRLTADFPGAAGVLKEALAIYRDHGDRLGQANALTELGVVRWLTSDYPAATQTLEEALGLYCDLGDRLGQAYALTELGDVRRLTSDYPAATQTLEEALGLYRGLSNLPGQAHALRNLGVVRLLTGDYPAAAQAAEEALGLYRDLSDQLGQANALHILGNVRRLTGNYPATTSALNEALGLYRDLGERLGQANALNELGIVRQLTGDYPAAAQILEEALGLYRDLGERLDQANALHHLGDVRRQTGDYLGAAGALEEALGIYRDHGDREGEAEVLNEAGTLHRVRDHLGQARACHRQALELAREIGSSWDEAHALAGLGRCAQADGATADAVASLRQAQQIFERIGAAEATTVAIELDALTDAEPTA